MKFVESPNLPKGRVKTVIADCKISKKSLDTLDKLGIKVILSCELASLYDAVNSHPDMMIHHLGNNKFVTVSEAYEHFTKAMPEAEIIKGASVLTDKYPNDIAYNAAAVNGRLICRRDYTDKEILSHYENILNVKQGYGKCSVCIVSKNAIITADSGIYEVAVNAGMDVLKIREGYIRLEGMNYGFIGGATGLISNDMLAVNGNIETHPDCGLIRDFCKKYGVEIISLNGGEITDIGSIIPVYEQ